MELTCGKQCPCWQEEIENAAYSGVCDADPDGPFCCDEGEECDVTASDMELWLRETEARAKMLQATIAARREAEGGVAP